MAGPSALEAALAKHRAELDAGERRAATRMVDAYGRAWADTRRELDGLLAKLEEARAAGTPISPAWLYQERRLAVVLGELEDGLRKWTPDAANAVRNRQRDAVLAAQGHAAELVEGALEADGIAATFEVFPEDALADLIGYTGAGSPLRAVFASLPGDAGDALERALVSGVALGRNPRAIARDAERAVGQSLTRALTIARTETLRAYRESTRRTLEGNPDVVAGWSWQCATDRRSCAACWAKHGTVYPVSESMPAHPNCRCSLVPLTRSWDQLGRDRTDYERPPRGIQTGPDLFAKLPEADQLAVLGPGKLALYKAGLIDLIDLVGQRTSRAWGVSVYEVSATAARTRAEVRRLRSP